MEEFHIAVGEEFFESLRRNGCYYVDKTEMLYQAAGNGRANVMLFTRPRRFGKTLTMSMFQSFFDITRDSRDVFCGLAVTRHEAFCREWMNQFPVLFISLKDAAGMDYDGAFKMLRTQISDLCKKCAYLIHSDKVDPSDVETFQKLRMKKADEEEVKESLLLLTRMLYAYYGKRAILLIDEYDAPLAKAFDRNKDAPGYYKKMLDMLRGLMSSSLKTNDYLEFAVITGCLRIAKESIFTGVNNFKTYSMIDNWFSDAFGFTEIEVEQLLKAAGFSDKMDVARAWYDGYVFGNTEIFCPWDVLNFVYDLIRDPETEPDDYWKDTSGNDIINAFVDDSRFDVSGKFEELMNGGTIEQTITDKLTYENLHEEEDNLWSVLFMTGYLTKADKSQRGRRICLKIPNAEIAGIFQDSVVRHFKKTMDKSVQQALLGAFWNGDEDMASAMLSELLWKTISYNDYHENYYHAFITGIFVGQYYNVKSNQENGLGRTDIVVRDRNNRRALIIETKKAVREEEMEKACLEGNQQITDKQYIRGLHGYKKIICYGISFYRKTALVRKLEPGV